MGQLRPRITIKMPDGDVVRSVRYSCQNGTPYVRLKNHPVGPAYGEIPVARIVLYEKIGTLDTYCHWCGTRLSWKTTTKKRGALHVEHLNKDRTDCKPENLVPSCIGCISSRRSARRGKIAILWQAIEHSLPIDVSRLDELVKLGEL